jgi:hypothetical protein
MRQKQFGHPLQVGSAFYIVPNCIDLHQTVNDRGTGNKLPCIVYRLSDLAIEQINIPLHRDFKIFAQDRFGLMLHHGINRNARDHGQYHQDQKTDEAYPVFIQLYKQIIPPISCHLRPLK